MVNVTKIEVTNLDQNIDYHVLCIDTSIFEKYGYNFRENSILYNLINIVKNSTVQIVIPDVIVREVINHLGARIEENRKKLFSTIKNFQSYEEFDDSEFNMVHNLKERISHNSSKETAKELFEDFVELISATILDTSDIQVCELFDRYFNNQPPFSESGKKKSEFPDALALLSLLKYSQKEKKKNILLLALDNDWKAFAEHSDNFYFYDDLKSYLDYFNIKYHSTEYINESLAEISQLFIQNFLVRENSKLATQLEKAIITEIEKSYPIVLDGSSFYHVDFDDEEIEYNDFDYVKEKGKSVLFITGVYENALVLETIINISVNVTGTASFRVWDSMDRDYVYIGKKDVSQEFSFDTEVAIVIKNENLFDIDNIEIVSISFDNFQNNFDFGNIELPY
jgi:hypothetical protein